MTPEEFAQALTEKFADQQYATRIFSVDNVGPKYTRIAQEQALEDFPSVRTSEFTNKSVHCFIENSTGHVFKAASWNRPAKGARFTAMEDALDAADVYGGYLYKR